MLLLLMFLYYSFALQKDEVVHNRQDKPEAKSEGDVRMETENESKEKEKRASEVKSGRILSVQAPPTMKQVADKFTLNERQRLVFYLIGDSLLRPLSNKDKTEQLLLHVHGPGGTGKSRIIDAVTDLFTSCQALAQIKVGAYTGVAAARIGGNTLDSLCRFQIKKKLPVDNNASNRNPGPNNSEQKFRTDFSPVTIALIDECSMLGQNKLQNIQAKMSRAPVENAEDAAPFGGRHIVYFGDFKQLPPVSDTALYMPFNAEEEANKAKKRAQKQQAKKRKQKEKKSEEDMTDDDNKSSKTVKTSEKLQQVDKGLYKGQGRHAWMLTNRVISLTDSKRQEGDVEYYHLLTRLANKQLTEQDLKTLKERELNHNNAKKLLGESASAATSLSAEN